MSTGASGAVGAVVTASGKYVFRVFFDRSAIRHRDVVVRELQDLGALVESSSASLVAVDAEDLARAQAIADYLVRVDARFGALYETGKSWTALLR